MERLEKKFYKYPKTYSSSKAFSFYACGMIKIDTNGAKKPNQAGNDLFEFHVASDGSIVPMGTQNDKFNAGYSKDVGYNPRANYMLGISQ